MELTTRELKEFLSDLIDTNKDLQKINRKPVSINIEGIAGIGKTSCIEQVCNEKKMDFIKINLAQIEEIGDLVGFPLKEFKIQKVDDPTVEQWVDEVSYSSWLTKGYKPTGLSRMAYAAPEWIAGREHPNGGVLLLDDWTRADQRFIQACMELIDRQTYISWSLPKGWTIILTSNPSDTTDYIVTEIDRAQKTRMMNINLRFDKESWAEWAENKIDGRCINFILLNEEVVKDDINPRVLEMFFNMVSTIPVFENSLPKIQMLGEASVGDGVATMFTQFINNKLDKLPAPEKVFKSESKAFLEEIKSVVGSGSSYRADIASVLAIRFANYISKYGAKNPIGTVEVDKVEALIDSNFLGEDNNFNLIKTIFASDKQKFRVMLQREKLREHLTR